MLVNRCDKTCPRKSFITKGIYKEAWRVLQIIKGKSDPQNWDVITVKVEE